MVDDFWSNDPNEWENFSETMARVLPNKPISDIALGDSVMHVLYDIQQKDLSFIPGTRHLRRGPGGSVEVQQPFGTNPAWRAMYDDKKRMVVGGQLQHGYRRCVGVCGCAGVSGAYDCAGLPLWDQLPCLLDDALGRDNRSVTVAAREDGAESLTRWTPEWDDRWFRRRGAPPCAGF